LSIYYVVINDRLFDLILLFVDTGIGRSHDAKDVVRIEATQKQEKKRKEMKLILVLLVAIAVVTQAFRVTNNGKFLFI
jgi:hypothetical protein